MLPTFIVAQLASAQDTGRVTSLSPTEQRTDKIFLDLIATHPDSGLNKQFNEWVSRRMIYVAYDSDRLPPEMSSELVRMQGREVPVLVINPKFLLGSTSFNSQDDKKYKQLVVLHEYIHIANHFSGKAKMVPPNFQKEGAAERAKNIWRSEWFATLAEWNLAKQIHGEHLDQAIMKEVKKYGEQRGFLEAFYGLIMTGQNSDQSQLLRPTWQMMYEMEKVKLVSKKK